MNEASEATAETRAPAKAREVDKVQMSDGSTVEFVGKRKLLKEPVLDGELPAVKFLFRNGNVILFTVPEPLLAQFAAHGAAQKIGDETAGEDDVDDMQLAVESIIERLNAGQWTKEREGGGFGGTSTLIQALVESSGKPVEVIRAFLKTKTKAEKDAMRASTRLKPIVDRLEQEKAAKAAHVDTDSLFADLESVG